MAVIGPYSLFVLLFWNDRIEERRSRLVSKCLPSHHFRLGSAFATMNKHDGLLPSEVKR